MVLRIDDAHQVVRTERSWMLRRAKSVNLVDVMELTHL